MSVEKFPDSSYYLDPSKEGVKLIDEHALTIFLSIQHCLDEGHPELFTGSEEDRQRLEELAKKLNKHDEQDVLHADDITLIRNLVVRPRVGRLIDTLEAVLRG